LAGGGVINERTLKKPPISTPVGRILYPLKEPNPVKETSIASRLHASGGIPHLPSPSKGEE